MEQNVQTFITWTHGVQLTWLQYHGPSLHDHLPGVQAERLTRVPVPPPLPPPPPPPPPPPEILHPQFLPSLRTSPTSSPRGQSCPATMTSERTRRSGRSADHLSADDLRSFTRTPKRTRTLEGAASTTAEPYSRRPFTVFTPKRSTRATRSRTTRCKHYCHAFIHHGRKCLSPCVRRQPGHFHCGLRTRTSSTTVNRCRAALCVKSWSALLADCAWVVLRFFHFCSFADPFFHRDAFGCHAQFDIWKREMGLPALLSVRHRAWPWELNNWNGFVFTHRACGSLWQNPP